MSTKCEIIILGSGLLAIRVDLLHVSCIDKNTGLAT